MLLVVYTVRQIWSRNSVQSWTPTSPSMVFGSSMGLCESFFQKYMARRRLLVQYVYISLTSSCCKMSWKHTAHTEVVNLSCSSRCTALKFHIILSHLGLERYWVGTGVDPSSKKVFSHFIWVLYHMPPILTSLLKLVQPPYRRVL